MLERTVSFLALSIHVRRIALMFEWLRPALTAEWIAIIVGCVTLVGGVAWRWWTRRPKLKVTVSKVHRWTNWVAFDLAVISLSERADTIERAVLRIQHSGRDYSFDIPSLVCGGHPLAFPADIELGKSITGSAKVVIVAGPKGLTGQVCVETVQGGKAKTPITIPPAQAPAEEEPPSEAKQGRIRLEIERTYFEDPYVIIIVQISNLAESPDTIVKATLSGTEASALPRVDRYGIRDVEELSLPMPLMQHGAEKGILAFALGVPGDDVLGRTLVVRSLMGSEDSAEITAVRALWGPGRRP